MSQEDLKSWIRDALRIQRLRERTRVRKCTDACRLWLLWFIGCGLLLLGWGSPAAATYIMRYNIITNGGMTYTGNTLGITTSAVGAIGAFLTPSGGTTTTWANNGSQASLVIPSGSTVLYAELIWGGSYKFGTQDVSAYLNNTIKFTPPTGTTYNIGPDSQTSATLTTPKNFYVRSANVTSYVQAAGAGTYTVAAVPATVNSVNPPNDDHAGWTLAVVYSNQGLAARSMSVYVGAEYVDADNPRTLSTVVGFLTKGGGTSNARMMVSAGEGEAGISGDQMSFGPSTASLTAISGPRNPVNNFFSSQINKDDGTTDTSGTYGTHNQPINGTDATNARQGWDITNIDVSSLITPGQTSAVAQASSTQDAYLVNSIGLQIDVDTPVLTTSLSVDKTTTYVGDTLTYTVNLSNAAGANDALNVFFKDPLPPGTSLIAGGVTVNGVTQPGANPGTGMALGTIGGGQTVTVQIKVHVDSIPAAPALSQYQNTASWTYQFRCLVGTPLNNGKIVTNTVTTTIVRLVVTKTVSPTTATAGTTLTYTITVQNTGTTNSSGTTLSDPIPASTTYVTRSTYLNGTRQTDGTGNTMPYATAKTINTSGAAAGVITAGTTATITFNVRISTNPTLPIFNVANVDPDGASGPCPVQQAAVSNPVSAADLGVTISDGVTSVIAGQTLTYTITVTNSSGSSTVTGLNLLFYLPAGFVTGNITPSSGSYNPSSGSWTGISLAAGGHVTLTVAGTVDPGASGSQTASATIAPPLGTTDNNAANNTATDTDTVTYQADITVSVTDNRTWVVPGQNLVYTVTITNNGPSTVNSVKVSNTFPSVFTVATYQQDIGVYDQDTQVFAGLDLQTGESVTLTVSGTVSSTASPGTMTYTVNVTDATGIPDNITANNTASDTDTIKWLTISGLVYQDINHDSNWDPSEAGTGISGLYAKIVQGSETTALQAVAVDPSTGSYQFGTLSFGTYKIVIDNNNTLTDITPTIASGWLATERATLISEDINLTDSTPNASGYNFGLYHGVKLTGTAFNDNGAGGGAANDGVQNGAEAGIDGVAIKVATGATVIDNTVTSLGGQYTVWIPYTYQGAAVVVTETNLANFISTGGKPGNTGGAYNRTTDAVSFTMSSGTLYSGVNFGDVPVNIFTNEGRQIAAPGSVALYPHTFTAGSKGQVTFTVQQATNPAGLFWTYSIYRDVNGNIKLDPTDTLVTGSISLNANDSVLLLVKDYVPAQAPFNASNQLKITALFTYDSASPALSASFVRTDLTIVDKAGASLALAKSVDRTNALPGDIIAYTITYVNNSSEALSNFVINDSTPSFTTFYAISFGTLPANLTACTTSKPTVGGTGALVWTFTGTLAPGSQGTVGFQVKLQ